jgi:protein tyrosine phosphatase (PTP) superfamily phosphohydrolase (DUF442 family)
MNQLLATLTAFTLLTTFAIAGEPGPTERTRLDQIEQRLKPDIPRILCLDASFATGAQPTDQAYGKLATSGFRSVLSLRAGNEGIDLGKERSLVERNKLRYFDIPVVSSAPKVEQADEFLRLVKDKTNHPMLINCSSANRVGAFMTIFRVVVQGWSEDKALDEAIRIGLKSNELKNFAKDYIAEKKPKNG